MKRLFEIYDQLVAPIRALQRHVDIQVLWPQCCRVAGETGPISRVTCLGLEIVHPIDNARAAFAMHAMGDRAWRVLGADEICRRIDALDWRLP